LTSPSPIHIRPSGPLAADALLPGDPGRALSLAQALLEAPRMTNHHRGLWGYTGETPGGHHLTIQATGMGGPSAAIVLQELAGLGIERAVRVGTCGALAGGGGLGGPALGDLVVAEAAICADGTSVALGADGRAEADSKLTAALGREAGVEPALIASTDLFYEPKPERAAAWVAQGAVAAEMEAATLFTVGERLGVAVGCVLAVSDLVAGERKRIGDEELAEAALRMGEAAAAALAG
jgi:uridine phosphorylase